MAIGDHGESLGEHGEDDHGIFLYEAVLRIPWIVRLPGSERRGSVINEQVRSIDLAPTLLDEARVQQMPGTGGESVAAVIRGRPRSSPPASYAETHYPRLHFGWSMLRSLRTGEWKYIDAPRPELYALGADAGEQHNLISERAKVVAGMAGQLASMEQGFGAPTGTAPTQPDLETIARLRSLGYVGMAAPGDDTTRGADPKDKIHQMKRFRILVSDAVADLGAKRTKAAITKLQEAVTIADRAYDVHVYLGDAWRQDGQVERALAEYDTAALLNPNTAAPHLLAADLYLATRQYDRALARLDQARKLEPRSAEVATARGRLYERTKRMNDALREYQHAVTLNPADLPARGRLVTVAVNLGRFELVEPHLRLLLERNYQPARTREILGYIAEQRGETRTAAVEYRRALELDPGLESARRALARITAR
jgi:Tfp pilus assembly protein PilF